MNDYVLQWLGLVVRWFHFTAGIAWIGASFYFVWLDDNLNRALPDGRTAPRNGGRAVVRPRRRLLPQREVPHRPGRRAAQRDLHWFYWEAYSTWLSGIAMLAIVYWAGASTFLIDNDVLALDRAGGDRDQHRLDRRRLVRVRRAVPHLREEPGRALDGDRLFLLFADWGLFHVFGRARRSSTSARSSARSWCGTSSSSSSRVSAGARADPRGRDPRPAPRAELGKQRSVHNTYFTLPVLFIMISNHYPMTYSGPYGWLVLAGLSIAGVLVRRFYVLTHFKRFVVSRCRSRRSSSSSIAVAIAPRTRRRAPGAPTFAEIAPIVAERCAVCHAAHPTYPGFSSAPAGILLDTPAHIVANAALIRAQAVATHAMPLGNVTHITDAERASSAPGSTQEQRPMMLTTHVLDTSTGVPPRASRSRSMRSTERPNARSEARHERRRPHRRCRWRIALARACYELTSSSRPISRPATYPRSTTRSRSVSASTTPPQTIHVPPLLCWWGAVGLLDVPRARLQ
jgi:uncharacterized membrane protein